MITLNEEKLHNQLTAAFKESLAYDSDTIESIRNSLLDTHQAVFEIELGSWDLIEKLELIPDLYVNAILLSEDENLYQIKLSN